MAHHIKEQEYSNLIPLLIILVIILVILFIPLRIMGYGFLPDDDILRHVAKAISGRDWNDILVLREGIKMDSHPGYHALLGMVYRITKLQPDALVFFAVTALFLTICLVPLFFIRRPEAWLGALLAVTLTNFIFINRILLGRPLILTMTTLIVLCLVWTRLKNKKIDYGIMSILTLMITLSVWIHCTWYMFIFVTLCFALAREWRVTARIGICMITGILLGAILTGSPILFFKQNLLHGFLAFHKHALPRTLAIEFRPLTGDIVMVIFVCLMLLWRKGRGDWNIKCIDNPVFIIAMSGWVLGFFVGRFWIDWGIPALLVWTAREFEEVFDKYIPFFSWRRFLLALAMGVVLYPAITNDINDRWSNQPVAEYLFKDSPEKTSWMPDPGGIVYSDDMRAFFLTFYKYPNAPWRYAVGFEPALMTQQDLDIFLNIHMTRCSLQSFYPWISKMKPADRLIITSLSDASTKIPELEWYDAGSGFWIGRLPRAKGK